MVINAISSVAGARATDGGRTIVLEMLDGAEQPVKVLLPLSVLERTIALLRSAGEQAIEMQAAATGRRGTAEPA